MIIISNSFSLSMLAEWRTRPHDAADEDPARWPAEPAVTDLRVTAIADPKLWLAECEPQHGAPAESAVGHADTAALFSALLGRPVEQVRRSVQLGDEDVLLVGQYVGPRLPEGSTTLPAGAAVRWLVVEIID